MIIEQPKDILNYKAKIIGDFSAREVVSILLGLGIGGFTYFKILPGADPLIREYVAVTVGVIFLAFGFVKLYGQPLEKMLPIFINDNLLLPLTRYYQMESNTAFLMEEAKLKPDAVKPSKNKDYEGIL